MPHPVGENRCGATMMAQSHPAYRPKTARPINPAINYLSNRHSGAGRNDKGWPI